MTSTRKSRRGPAILWAFDPFEKEAKPSASAIGELEHWAEVLGAELVPTYIATRNGSDVSLGYLAPVVDLEKRLNESVRALGLTKARAGVVLVEETTSRRSAVGRLLELARHENASAIALSSHGRSGLERFMLGSFAENLLRESTLPLYFLSRKHHAGPAPKEAARCTVFATDFSENSHVAFRKFLELAAAAAGRVVLFHSVGIPLPYGSGESLCIPENYFEEEETWARKKADGWIAEAKAAGVAAELLVRDGGTGFMTGDVVQKAARDLGAGLVAMASTSGPLDRALFGSAAYDVFRASPCPVLIYGPNALRASATGVERQRRQA